MRKVDRTVQTNKLWYIITMITVKSRKNDLQILMETVEKLEIELQELRKDYAYHVHKVPGGRAKTRDSDI